MDFIPFNSPYMTNREIEYIRKAHEQRMLGGDGAFTKACQEWLGKTCGTYKGLLTHSCTAALEMAALLIDIEAGDEIIMPSYTFASTANAFVLRGAVPVFIDIRDDTLNMDERLLEEAITPRTRAIVPVHYAGVSCDMDSIMSLAKQYGLKVIEDAAQGVMASYKGRMLGSIGDLGAYSFHETKNVISGEGGALLVNDTKLAKRAEIIREKGTDRSQFFRGEVDKYTWQDLGSSFLPGELVAAFLLAQLEVAQEITDQRKANWMLYHQLLEPLELKGLLRRPYVPAYCQHNAHIYHVLLHSEIDRQGVISVAKKNGISLLSHYEPLHLSPAGIRFGRAQGNLPVTVKNAGCVLRLPLFGTLTASQQARVTELLSDTLTR